MSVPSLPLRDGFSDRWLGRRARAGCADAFPAIVRRYERPLHAYCARLVGHDMARDAVQQAFLHALVALRREERSELELRPWLYRIARNCSLDLLRRTDREWGILDPGLEGGMEPDEIVARRESLDAVLASLRALPEAQRMAIVLREVEGRSYHEIAAQLGRSPAGVRQAIFRARTALRGESFGRADLRGEGQDQTCSGRMSDAEDELERELQRAFALLN
jgi:RNA polymerase sigma factor (sigma-70 family)